MAQAPRGQLGRETWSVQGLLVRGWEEDRPQESGASFGEVLKLMHEPQILQAPGPSPALSLVWHWSRRQTLPGRTAELEVGGRRCLGWPPKGRLREEEEEVEEKGGGQRLGDLQL